MSTKIAFNSENNSNNFLFELQIGTVLGDFRGLPFQFLWETPARLLIRLYILMGMIDYVEREREDEAVGRAGVDVCVQGVLLGKNLIVE